MMTRGMKALGVACAAMALVYGAGRFRAAQHTPSYQFQEAIDLMETKGDYPAAIRVFEELAKGADRNLAARSLLYVGLCYEKLGKDEARKAYERVLRDYADQSEAASEARTRLARLRWNARLQGAGIVARQVWEGDTLSVGRPSPDGRYVAWVNWPGSAGNLATHDLLTGENRNLTKGQPGSFAEAPVFSPDGKQIMYGWYNSATDKWEVRLIQMDGSKERAFVVDAYSGAICPDGTHAAISVEQNGSQQLALIDLTSGKVIALKTVGWRKPEIGNFSPDGRYFVYSALVTQDSRDREVYAMAVDASSEYRLVAAPGVNGGAFYTPDGSRVVFTSDRSGRWDLWAVRVSAGKAEGAPQLVKTDIGSVKNLGFTRDGTLYLSQRIDQRDAYTAEVNPATWTIKGSPNRVSDRFTGNSAAPRWSSDGGSLAYAAFQGQTDSHGSAEVSFIIRGNGSPAEREFKVPFRAAALAGNFRWFPDSKSLLLVEWGPPGVRTFRRLDLSKGEVHLLFQAPFGRPESTSITSDGRNVLYSSPGSQSSQLIEHNLQTGEERTLTKLHGNHAVAISPDATRVASMDRILTGMEMSGWSVWLTRLDAGEAREVWRPKDHWLQPGTMAWDPQGRGLLVISSEGKDYWAKEQGIWYVPLDGGEPHNIGVRMPRVESISIRPDGRCIGFAGGSSTEQVWSLKNLFPEIRAVR